MNSKAQAHLKNSGMYSKFAQQRIESSVSERVLKISQLKIEPLYQRTLDQKSLTFIRKAVANFDEKLMRPIAVNVRSDGNIYVIDGQHRIEICKGIGKDFVKAIIYTGLSVEEEAEMFDRLNSEVNPISTREIFHSKLVYDQQTKEINALVESFGLELQDSYSKTRGAKRINALRRFRNLYESLGESILSRALELLTSTWNGCHLSLTEPFLCGVSGLVKEYGHLFTNKDFVSKLSKISPEECIQKYAYIKKVNSSYTTEKAAVATFKEIYNSGKNVKRLP